GVRLVAIRRHGAVVARVADAVGVRVGLALVGRSGTVVGSVGDPVTVTVASAGGPRRAASAAADEEQGEREGGEGAAGPPHGRSWMFGPKVQVVVPTGVPCSSVM